MTPVDCEYYNVNRCNHPDVANVVFRSSNCLIKYPSTDARVPYGCMLQKPCDSIMLYKLRNQHE